MNARFWTRWAIPAMAGAMLAFPALSHAQDDDIGVTMRMVADDQELDESLVQELTLPSSLDEAETGDTSLEPGVDDIAGDTLEDMRDLETSLSEQSRETRDALGEELTGELDPGLDLPELESPELESPELEIPELETPETEDPGLDLLNSESISLEESQ